ncbi:MAG: radical SAM protein, partial [Elusimicrobia bacterium]|nr:radical SAM protein [Elusimicrobiota bacterium]
RHLAEGRARGADAVVLTGGEPTLHRALLATARKARALGYRTVQLQTNGRALCYERGCRELADAGVTEFSPALHGSRPEVHDFLVRAPGAWLQTVTGLRNLRRLGLPALANSVVTKSNYRDLPDLARLLVSLGVRQYQFAFVHLAGTAAANASWLVPRKALAAPYVQEGLAVGEAAGVPCFVEAFPPCLLGRHARRASEPSIPRTRVIDAERVTEDYTAYRRERGKAKGPACTPCLHAGSCEGPWREYPELFGWEEFRPPAAGALLQSKPDA